MIKPLLLASALMFSTILAANAVTYVAPPAPMPVGAKAFHLAAFKNGGGCTAEADAHCQGQPDFDQCVAAYHRAHHC